MSTSSVRAPIDVQDRHSRPAGPASADRRATGSTTGPRRLMLLGGPVTVALYVLGMALAGEAPAVDASAGDLTGYWADSANVLTGFLVLVAAMTLAAFGAGLASALRDAGDDGPLPVLAGIGAAVSAGGLTLTAMLALALHDAADKVDGTAVQSLNVLFDNLFMPIVAGFGLVLAAAGFSARRTGLLPAALAWPAIVLGVIAPLYFAGFATYVLGGAWFAVTGIVLSRRTPAHEQVVS